MIGLIRRLIAVAVVVTTVPAVSEPVTQLAYARNKLELARLARADGNLEQALRHYRNAFEIARGMEEVPEQLLRGLHAHALSNYLIPSPPTDRRLVGFTIGRDGTVLAAAADGTLLAAANGRWTETGELPLDMAGAHVEFSPGLDYAAAVPSTDDRLFLVSLTDGWHREFEADWRSFFCPGGDHFVATGWYSDDVRAFSLTDRKVIGSAPVRGQCARITEQPDGLVVENGCTGYESSGNAEHVEAPGYAENIDAFRARWSFAGPPAEPLQQPGRRFLPPRGRAAEECRRRERSPSTTDSRSVGGTESC